MKEACMGRLVQRMASGVMAGLVAAALGATLARAETDPAKVRAAEQPVLVLKEEQQGVAAVAYSPDGKQLAGVGGDGKARVWDASSGELLQTMGSHDRPATSLAWSPDGKWLATGGYDACIFVWDVATGEQVDRHEQLCPVIHLAFLPDGKRLVSICGEMLRWWEVGTEEELFAKKVGNTPRMLGLAVTPEGEVVASDGGGLVVVLDGKDGKRLAEMKRPGTMPEATKATDHSNWVCSIAPLGKSKVVLADRMGVWLWDWKAETTKKLKGGGALGAGTAADGEMLVMTLRGMVQTLDIERQTVVVKQVVDNPEINGLAIAPDGEHAAVANGGGWIDSSWTVTGTSAVYVYDLKAAAALMAIERAEKAKPGE